MAKYGLVHISTGDLLRAEVAAGTPAGLKAKAFMDRGDLVPDEVIVEFVLARVAQPDVKAKGWLLDGFPRSAVQASALAAAGITPSVFLLLDVPDEVLIERYATSEFLRAFEQTLLAPLTRGPRTQGCRATPRPRDGQNLSHQVCAAAG